MPPVLLSVLCVDHLPQPVAELQSLRKAGLVDGMWPPKRRHSERVLSCCGLHRDSRPANSRWQERTCRGTACRRSRLLRGRARTRLRQRGHGKPCPYTSFVSFFVQRSIESKSRQSVTSLETALRVPAWSIVHVSGAASSSSPGFGTVAWAVKLTMPPSADVIV